MAFGDMVLLHVFESASGFQLTRVICEHDVAWFYWSIFKEGTEEREIGSDLSVRQIKSAIENSSSSSKTTSPRLHLSAALGAALLQVNRKEDMITIDQINRYCHCLIGHHYPRVPFPLAQ